MDTDKIGTYSILRQIGRGGMGEVYLALDDVCKRHVALKRIRKDLREHAIIRDRFLREARICSRLSHPAIIPIYSITVDAGEAYYTMPFVEGETLREILKATYDHEVRGEKPHSIGGSLPALIRLFSNICQGIAYAHSLGVLHRDLKPENIMVGKFGEVFILDWGLAKLTHDKEDEINIDDELIEEDSDGTITHPGKVIGTVQYMPPERALGHDATIQTDIYALGVILYQMLTLKLPFKRKSIKDYRLHLHEEVLTPPEKLTPSREVPQALSKIVEKSLSFLPQDRYQSLPQMLTDIEAYLEGRSDWHQVAALNPQDSADWEFQENVLVTRHLAVTRSVDTSDWVSLMISKVPFSGNLMLQTRFRLNRGCQGIGFLCNVPEPKRRSYPTEGYCIWFSATEELPPTLWRSNIAVTRLNDFSLDVERWYDLRIESIDNNLYCYLDQKLIFAYICHIPLSGDHVGFAYKDTHFEVLDLLVHEGSINLTLGCLAIPDAFLKSKNFQKALLEYRKISNYFPERKEGREAVFRAGLTLLEQMKDKYGESLLEAHCEDALNEFEKLKETPRAPLAYLGRSLVYHAINNSEEEAKCLEFALRKFHNHPLLPLLEEQVIYRMHESSRLSRRATYRFALLVMNVLPNVRKNPETIALFENLQHYWETPYFIEPLGQALPEVQDLAFAMRLAFWLNKPYNLEEILQTNKFELPLSLIRNVFFTLLELGAHSLLKEVLPSFSKEHPSQFCYFDVILSSFNEDSLNTIKVHLTSPITPHLLRIVLFLMDLAIDREDTKLAEDLYLSFFSEHFSADVQLAFHTRLVWVNLLSSNWAQANILLQEYPFEMLHQETTLLYFLYGCSLRVLEGHDIAQIHFSGILKVPYPQTWTLFTHYLNENEKGREQWVSRLFHWERKQLYRQAILFYHCTEEHLEKAKFQELLKGITND